MHSNFHKVLCIEKEIEVRNGNEDTNILENPSIVDFLRMIATDGIWGNEGAMIALSQALEAGIFIFIVSGILGQSQLLLKVKPTETKMSKVLTIINMDYTHFYVSRLRNKKTDMNQFIKNNHTELKNVTIIEHDINDVNQKNLAQYNQIKIQNPYEL